MLFFAHVLALVMSLVVPIVSAHVRHPINLSHPNISLTDTHSFLSPEHVCTNSHFQSFTAFGVLSLIFMLSAHALRRAVGVSLVLLIR